MAFHTLSTNLKQVNLNTFINGIFFFFKQIGIRITGEGPYCS
jgi:hypothetical protein